MSSYIQKYTPIKNKQYRMKQIFCVTTPLPGPVADIIIDYVTASEEKDAIDIAALHEAIQQFLKFILQRSYYPYSCHVAILLKNQEEMEWEEWVHQRNPHHNLWMYVKYHQYVQPVVQRLKILIKDCQFRYSTDKDEFQLVTASYHEDLNIPEPEVAKSTGFVYGD